jgi:hypothetical protein
MIVPVYIDYTSITEKYSQLTHEQINTMCDNIAKNLARRYAEGLEVEANNSLHQTRKRYVQNISVIDSGKLEGTVILDYSKDKLIKMIEEGATPFDMKRAMLASPKAKTKNGKRYITIPFRFGTPDAVAESDVFSGKLPDEVYEVIKGKEANIAHGTGSRSSGLTKKELPAQYQSPQTRAAIKDSAGKILFNEYKHKTSIYQGIAKYKDGVTGQNTYRSFRRVSENSDPLAFVHPGIEKYNLVQKALSNFKQEREVSVSLTNEFKRLGLI